MQGEGLHDWPFAQPICKAMFELCILSFPSSFEVIQQNLVSNDFIPASSQWQASPIPPASWKLAHF
jgi:hypothetical protein